MTDYGKAVLWMGLILMALQIAAEWSLIRSVIFSNSSGSGGSSGGFQIPSLPFPLPFPLLATPAQHNTNNRNRNPVQTV